MVCWAYLASCFHSLNPMRTKILIILTLLGLNSAMAVDLSGYKMPPGFVLETYAENVTNARQMARGKNGTIFVGSRSAGVVNALVDKNGDGKADEVIEVASGLNMPSGIAIKGDDLYVAAVNQVIKYADIEKRFRQQPKGQVIIDDLPADRHHGWKYIDFGPDGWLYVPVGTPCNVCQTKGGDKFDDPRYDSIIKYNLATKEKRWVARGVRNSVGFDWHPVSNKLWFSDNGRDWLGDNLPPCEINRVDKEGSHFGYPYFHGGWVMDPEFGRNKNPDHYVKPAYNLGAHVAPLGIHFYTGNAFPDEYQHQLLVAEHGSWNRTERAGYRVMMAKLEAGEVKAYQPLITGFIQNDKVVGRPVAFLPMPDGSLLISDDFAHAVYRLRYRSSDTAQ